MLMFDRHLAQPHEIRSRFEAARSAGRVMFLPPGYLAWYAIHRVDPVTDDLLPARGRERGWRISRSFARDG